MSKKNATIKSIAAELGVSASTVSRVLNGVGKKYRISTKTIDAVQEMAKSLEYAPNVLAKSLRLNKSSTIGLVVPDISNPWFAKIAKRIEAEARKKGYNIFLYDSDNDLETEQKAITLLQNWMVDGIIIVPIGLEASHLVDASSKGTPVVLIDRYFEHLEIPYVSTNDLEGAYKAVKHLIQNGHKNIACIQGVRGTSSNNQRISGYKKALKEGGIAFDKNLVLGNDFGFENGYHQTLKVIKHLKEVTALFSTGNQITLGALKALAENDIAVPKDISIVSYDEHDYSELLYTPLTTVSHLESHEIGEIALDLLFAPDAKKTQNTLLPVTLIKRKSVKNLNAN